MLLKNLFRRNESVHVYEDLLNGDRNKGLARYIVLNDIKPFEGDGIGFNSEKHVHIVVVGFDPLSLCVARQAALICHYPNFKESEGEKRTKITIVNYKSTGREDVEKLKSDFESTTGNLISESIWKCISCEDKRVEWYSANNDSFIDLEFEFIGLQTNSISTVIKETIDGNENTIVSVIDNSDLESGDDSSFNLYQTYKVDVLKLSEKVPDFKIDVTKAQKINVIYQCGTGLENITNIDKYDADAYNSSLKTFCSHLRRKKYVEEWDKIDDPTIKLSNVFCADCIDVKNRCLETANRRRVKASISSDDLRNLAKSEHNRWNVEKLILGYRPLNDAERMEDNRLLKADKEQLKAYRKFLKKEKHAHIDICSCSELKRVDFDNFKYDCLLTLAIREIK